jgi:response regulator RpfG family c-di-GMP phosphodiesterase
MSYILVVDDEADIREIFEMILKRSFELNVIVAQSGNKAVEIIREKGQPLIIISDMNMADGDGLSLYNALKTNNWPVPFVICSTDANNLKKKFPDIHGFIEKPNIIGPVVELVGGVVNKPKEQVEYVPIRISLLLRWGSATFNLFMKLSDKKYVKVLKSGDAFLSADAERFYAKGIHLLYITSSESDFFIEQFVSNLTAISDASPKSPHEMSVVTLESLETVGRIAKSVGWKAEVVEAAKHAVNLALKTITKEPGLLKLLKSKMSDPNSKYANHVSILSLMSCGFCHIVGWTNESTQMKLGLAALMHDISLDESYYDDINKWNLAASDKKIKSPEVQKYRNHPVDSANLVLTMKHLPSDIDQIILQHHEAKEGKGFPRGLISSRISPMACVFIITEDLINFIDNSDDMDERIRTFLKLNEQKYNSGNFKKIFDAFRDSIEKNKVERPA